MNAVMACAAISAPEQSKPGCLLIQAHITVSCTCSCHAQCILRPWPYHFLMSVQWCLPWCHPSLGQDPGADQWHCVSAACDLMCRNQMSCSLASCHPFCRPNCSDYLASADDWPCMTCVCHCLTWPLTTATRVYNYTAILMCRYTAIHLCRHILASLIAGSTWI